MPQTFGQQSEDFVKQFLCQQNFTIITQNYKKFFGEIDIIAHQQDLVVFVEVKARKNSRVSLHNLVTHSKQQKIIKTAQDFISNHANLHNKTFRFDVALLHIQNGQAPELTYIPNAFTMQEF